MAMASQTCDVDIYRPMTDWSRSLPNGKFYLKTSTPRYQFAQETYALNIAQMVSVSDIVKAEPVEMPGTCVTER